jgi:hypothetical protein
VILSSKSINTVNFQVRSKSIILSNISMYTMSRHIINKINQLRRQVSNEISNRVYNNLRRQYNDSLSSNSINKVKDQVYFPIRDQGWDIVCDRIGHQVINQIRYQVTTKLLDPVYFNMRT